MLQHPDITRAHRTGYPVISHRREEYGVDGLGNEVLTGDPILVLNEEFFQVDELFQETIEALEVVGATHEVAR